MRALNLLSTVFVLLLALNLLAGYSFRKWPTQAWVATPGTMLCVIVTARSFCCLPSNNFTFSGSRAANEIVAMPPNSGL